MNKWVSPGPIQTLHKLMVTKSKVSAVALTPSHTALRFFVPVDVLSDVRFPFMPKPSSRPAVSWILDVLLLCNRVYFLLLGHP